MREGASGRYRARVTGYSIFPGYNVFNEETPWLVFGNDLSVWVDQIWLFTTDGVSSNVVVRVRILCKKNLR